MVNLVVNIRERGGNGAEGGNRDPGVLHRV